MTPVVEVDYASLRSNVSFLGRLLGDTISAADGEDFLALIEKIRLLSRSAREGSSASREELLQVMRDMRAHDIDMITLGQYLQPSRDHLPVARFVPPEEFDELGAIAGELGFKSVASGPLVRSSYHADQQVDLGSIG